MKESERARQERRIGVEAFRFGKSLGIRRHFSVRVANTGLGLEIEAKPERNRNEAEDPARTGGESTEEGSMKLLACQAILLGEKHSNELYGCV